MIHLLTKKFKKLDRDVDALTFVIVLFLLVLAWKAAWFVFEKRFDDVWTLLPQITPLLVALVVVRVANRLIVNGDIIREDERRQELVRTVHHLLAIASDLYSRVGYLRSAMTNENTPSLALVQLARTIEGRYETLLERDGYKYLPSNCVGIILRIASDIFGIGLMAEQVKHVTSTNPALTIKEITNLNLSGPLDKMDKLLTELESLVNEIHSVRASIEPIESQIKPVESTQVL